MSTRKKLAVVIALVIAFVFGGVVAASSSLAGTNGEIHVGST